MIAIVSSVTLGRPFCSAVQTFTVSLLELSTAAISHVLKARRYFQSKDSACSQSAAHFLCCYMDTVATEKKEVWFIISQGLFLLLWPSFLTVMLESLQYGHIAEKSDRTRSTGSQMIRQALMGHRTHFKQALI